MYDSKGRPITPIGPQHLSGPRPASRESRAGLVILMLFGFLMIAFTVLSLFIVFGWKAGFGGIGLVAQTFGVLLCWAAICEPNRS